MKRCNISNISIWLALLVLSLSPWADVARAQPKKDLNQAAVDGDLDRVKALVADGENINSVNMMSMTPLVVAAWHDHMDVCEFLVEKGADLNAKDRSSRTALYFAVTNNNKELVELLVKKGADVNITTGSGDNAFSLAKKNGNTEIANFLAKNGAKDPVVQLGYGDEYYGEEGVSRPVPGGSPRQGMTPNIAQTAVEVDLLADPNEIMARIKTFKGLEKIILDLGKKSSTELRYWGQIKYDNRTTLVRYVEKQIEDELAAIKKIAVEEKAAKTTKAIDTLSENTKKLYSMVSKELRQQRREAVAGQSSRGGRGRSRGSSRYSGRPRGYSPGYPPAGSQGDALYDDAGRPGMPPGRGRYGRSSAKPEEQVDPQTQQEINQWLQTTTPDKKPELAKAIHQLIYADYAYIRGLAVEEKAEKTTAAIDGILLARQVRFDVYVKTMEALKQAAAAAQDPSLAGQGGNQNMQTGVRRGRGRGSTSQGTTRRRRR